MELRELFVVLLFCLCSTSGHVLQERQAGTCGYASCHPTQPGMLNVHVLSHSHDDVGWLKTVDQYFLGSNRAGWTWDNQKVGVTDVLDSVLRSLYLDPNKKYIQVETAFFWRWWQQQEDRTKDMFRTLVDNGQLEFIGGGWSMNDEGAAHYVAIVDQMSLGFRILNQTFGECGRPRIAWQVDPFGHSKEQAHLFKEMGFDGYFFGRLDYRDKDIRMAAKTMEMMWETSPDLPGSDLFTGINFNVYWPPDNFCWDVYCNDEPMMDNPNLKDYNVDRRVDEFLAYVARQSAVYKSDNIMVTFGMDFHYQASHFWFKNIDKLIKHVNARQSSGSNINMIYSTPSCYLQSLRDSGTDWPAKTDDFFPYASDDHAYWTGYFTSRPTSKRMMHEASQILQVAKHMSTALHNAADPAAADLMQAKFALERAVGVAQHHDAITGTEKQHVADDYHERLASGVSYFTDTALAASGFQHCPLLNISQCEVTETSDTFTVGVYNALAWRVSRFVSMPVVGEEFKVTAFVGGAEVPCQTVPLPVPVISIPGRVSPATHELVFKAEDLPPLGTAYFVVEKATNPASISELVPIPVTGVQVGDETGTIEVNGVTRRITRFFGKDAPGGDDVTYTFNQQLMYYDGFEGDNNPSDERASGAYVFRPKEQVATEYPVSRVASLYDGPVFSELQETTNDHISQTSRIYKGDSAFDIEVTWQVGPIPIDDGGKEVINRISVAEIANAMTFETDANGRQMMARVRDFRPTFPIGDVQEPVSQNYYPVNSRISIKDQAGLGARLTVMNDRSQAGGSIHDGEVELLLHRRLRFDDAFGVDEELDETAFDVGLVARGKHYLLFNLNDATANVRHRILGTELFNAPFLTFLPGAVDQATVDGLDRLNVNLQDVLPPNLHLLTLEPWYTEGEVPGSNRFFLVRIEHIFQTTEDPNQHSMPATADLSALLSSLGMVVSLKETTLGANQFKDEVTLMDWTKETDSYMDVFMRKMWPTGRAYEQPRQSEVGLTPMQIRTFVVEIQ